MPNHRIELTLTDQMLRSLEARIRESSEHSSVADYIRSLVREEMDDWEGVSGILQGLREAQRGDFVDESILDILDEP